MRQAYHDIEYITDKNGNVKKGFEVFDLNGDGKIDNQEKGYFSSAGHSSQTHNENVDLSEFLKAIKELDKVGYVEAAENNIKNNIVIVIIIINIFEYFFIINYMI